MAEAKGTEAHFSDICIERCGGMCCDPWWGIISYTVRRPAGGDWKSFAGELERGVRARARRIIDAYVTKESPPRPLFAEPDVYNVKVRSIRADGAAVSAELVAMYAFRCAFLSDDNVCTIHPAVIGGSDIRPPHCGELGDPGARPGEKGFCRIIHAAGPQPGGDDGGAVDAAIGLENETAGRHLKEGFPTAAEAAASAAGEIKRWCEANMAGTGPARSGAKVGRNDPCPCGSGKKFKKCCGS